MSQKRIYIVTQGHEPVDNEAYSSMKKVSEIIQDDVSYYALSHRLQRAKLRTGKSKIFIEDKDGNPITVEIREIK